MKPPGRPEVPILDTAVLSDRPALGDEGTGFVERVLELFFRASRAVRVSCMPRFRRHSFARPAAATHTIKGSCGAIGAVGMARPCEEIEEQIACGDVVGAVRAPLDWIPSTS